MSLGTTLRESRLRAGLTQADLAERSATSQATLSAYEHDRKSPTVATLERILAATGHRLTAERGPVLITPGRQQLERNAETLELVLGLAAELPTEHDPELAYPPMREMLRAPWRRS